MTASHWVPRLRVDHLRKEIEQFKTKGADEQDVAFQAAVRALERASDAIDRADFEEANIACTSAEICLGVVDRDVKNDDDLHKAIEELLNRATQIRGPA